MIITLNILVICSINCINAFTAHTPILLQPNGEWSTIQAVGSPVQIEGAFILGSEVKPKVAAIWIFHGVEVAYSTVEEDFSIHSRLAESNYSSRVSIRNSPDKISSQDEMFTTTLTLQQLQKNESGIYLSVRLGPATVFTPTLYVMYCPSNLSTNVEIATTNGYEYEALGHFKCLDEEELFFQNSTLLPNNQTYCAASAEWRNQEIIQCWTEPVVSMDGNFTLYTGDDLKFNCSYEDVIPSGDSTLLYVGGVVVDETKSWNFTLSSLQPQDNNIEIFCQAVTPYTKIYNDTGRSATHTINVLYKPYQKQSTSCLWLIDQPQWCIVTFLANPKPQFVSLTKNYIKIDNDVESIVSVINEDYLMFAFHKNNVSLFDNGSYVLDFGSSAFSSDSSILFSIFVHESPSPSNQCDCDLYLNVTIALSIIAAFLLAASIGVSVKLWTSGKNKS